MNWVQFLEENHIHYVTRGPNTKRGELSIKCPMCDDDPSEHLGINPESGFWGCHRNQAHRGKSARTLIKALLGCSNQQAQFIIKQYDGADPDSLSDMLSALEGVDSVPKKASQQKSAPTLDSFYNIKPRGITKRFFTYLQDRGYTNPQDIIEKYNLKCAMTGRYKDRVIIPVSLNDELLGWTSRAIIEPRNAPRYLMSSEDVKTTIFNYDELKEGGRRLFIVEGPFDAIKVDSFGDKNVLEHYRATCTFGTSVSISQISLLRSLVKKYDESIILFDKGADQPAINLAEWVGARVGYLPSTVKDPGELQFKDLEFMGTKSFMTSWWPWTSPLDRALRASDY